MANPSPRGGGVQGVFRAYASGWLRTLDLRGRSTRGDIWGFTTVFVLLCALLTAFAATGAPGFQGVIGTVTVSAILAHRVPYTTLFVRRLRDAGLWRVLALVLFVPDITLAWIEFTRVFPDDDDGVAMLQTGMAAMLVLVFQVVVSCLPSAGADHPVHRERRPGATPAPTPRGISPFRRRVATFRPGPYSFLDTFRP